MLDHPISSSGTATAQLLPPPICLLSPQEAKVLKYLAQPLEIRQVTAFAAQAMSMETVSVTLWLGHGYMTAPPAVPVEQLT
jgi:hypothetical protein